VTTWSTAGVWEDADAGLESGLPHLIPLALTANSPRRSFRATRYGLGCLASAVVKFTGSRVPEISEKSTREERIWRV
jgi:hypothetical protein